MSASAMAMPDEAAVRTWPERNQRWLSERIAFWRERIDRRETDGVTAHPSTPPAGEDGDFQPAAMRLRALFGLSPFETELLVLAAGVEIDAGFRASVAQAQGTSARDAVSLSFSLALALLPESHWDVISPLGPLRHWSLLEFDLGPGAAQSLVRIDERVLHYLTGVAAFDPRLQGLATLDDTVGVPSDRSLPLRIVRALGNVSRPLVMLSDATSDGGRRRQAHDVARAVFRQMGLRMLLGHVRVVAGDARDIVEAARRLDREAALSSAGVALALDTEGRDVMAVVRFISALRSPIVLFGAIDAMHVAEIFDRQVFRFNVGQPTLEWPGATGPTIKRAAERALQQFRVESAVLEQALASVRDLSEAAIEPALWDALREAARGGLDTLAQRIDSGATFNDLVLPTAALAQLRQITNRLCHRQRVYEEWGFGERSSRGLGIAALFAGESGTGKTLAAEVIANEARLDLYRIDLASVVSKYIGETEKNLARLFDAAERSGAVLLFDEAEALFGKRSEVKDSHDRYANIEVAYLLQRIESYRGLAILTTNLKGALDRAFLRRIQFVVQFPFPHAGARTEIWSKVFPRQAPLRDIDMARLGRLNLSGGSIRSVAVGAAFIAAARGGEIDTPAVLEAARAEYAKLERPIDAALEDRRET